jgi:archaellum component FlaC
LSLAACIVGLVSRTIQILQFANKFKDDVKGVSKEVGALIKELNALNSTLEMLKKALEHKRAPANIDLSALARIETTCEAQLNDLLEKLRKNEARLQKCIPDLHATYLDLKLIRSLLRMTSPTLALPPPACPQLLADSHPARL